VLWVGTDDGRVHLTRDAGVTWTEVTDELDAAGGPADRWVSRVFASPHAAGTAFVAKNGFRNDDFRPFLHRTDDFGATWEAIGGGLPESPINVVVQDVSNADLLIVGNDLGVWVSIDDAVTWERLHANLPTVPVHDLTIHPRENDLVLGTYGRALWVGDITALRQLTPAIAAAAFHVFDPEPRAFYGFRAVGNYPLFGDKYLATPNEPDALVIEYALATADNGAATIVISDTSGAEIATLDGTAAAGLNRVLWDMRPGNAPAGNDWGARMRRFRTPPLPAGEYRIEVRVAADVAATTGTIREVTR
jgi:hypothetical protein